MARILRDYPFVLGQEMEEAVFQALGYASRCWDADGVFEPDKAKQVGDELMGVIVQYAQAYPCEHTADGQRMRES